MPYVSGAKKLKGQTWRFKFNGGEVDAELSKLDCIMFYGATGEIPIALIDALATHRVPLLVHRRNVGRPAVFLPAPRVDAEDMLTRQILARTNAIKRTYIARTLVRERFRSVEGALKVAASNYRRLAKARNLMRVRIWEAEHARRYWTYYFARLGHADVSRRSKGPLPSALDAGSMFLSGVILRWLLVHRLSQLKRSLEKVVYVPATRQFVRRKNLLHGSVLALRAYLAGDMRRFVVPAEGERKGGRPPKVSYRLPGNIPEFGKRSAPF